MVWDQPVNGWELVIGFVLTFVAALLGAIAVLSRDWVQKQADRQWSDHWGRTNPFWEARFDPETRELALTNIRRTALHVRVVPVADDGMGLMTELLHEDTYMREGDTARFKVPVAVMDGLLGVQLVGGIRINWVDTGRPRWWHWWSWRIFSRLPKDMRKDSFQILYVRDIVAI